MLKFQEYYEKMIKLCAKDVIKELNSEFREYKSILKGFGIAIFTLLAGIGFYFIPAITLYGCECVGCENMTPIKRVLVFYLILSPCIFLSIWSFFITLNKKGTYNKLLNKEYIDEYKIEDALESSIVYNNIQFIILLITLSLIIVYPILIKLITCKRPLNYINYNEISRLRKLKCDSEVSEDLIQNNQTSNDFNNEQNNSDDNYNDYPDYPEYPTTTGTQKSINFEAPKPAPPNYDYQYTPK